MSTVCAACKHPSHRHSLLLGVCRDCEEIGRICEAMVIPK